MGRPPNLAAAKVWIALHWINMLYLALYPYLYRGKRADIFYIGYFLFVTTFHWRFVKKECVVSLKEKQALVPDYQTGMCDTLHPWVYPLSGDNDVVYERIRTVSKYSLTTAFVYTVLRQSWTFPVKVSVIACLVLFNKPKATTTDGEIQVCKGIRDRVLQELSI